MRFSEAAECCWLSDSWSTHPLTPTSWHPLLALRLRTHNYRPEDCAAPTRRWKSIFWTITCLQETVYWHRPQHDSLHLRFISRAKKKQQQPAANSPTKVMAVPQKGSSLQYFSMSWHGERVLEIFCYEGQTNPDQENIGMKCHIYYGRNVLFCTDEMLLAAFI